MNIKSEQTASVDVHIAGPYEEIVRLCRAWCTDVEPCCVHVVRQEFAYRWGQESGAKVGLVNYPRFPLGPTAVVENEERARRLAAYLMEHLKQSSALVESARSTIWMSVRDD